MLRLSQTHTTSRVCHQDDCITGLIIYSVVHLIIVVRHRFHFAVARDSRSRYGCHRWTTVIVVELECTAPARAAPLAHFNELNLDCSGVNRVDTSLCAAVAVETDVLISDPPRYRCALQNGRVCHQPPAVNVVVTPLTCG